MLRVAWFDAQFKALLLGYILMKKVVAALFVLLISLPLI